MNKEKELLNEIDRLRLENMNLQSKIYEYEDELEYMTEEIEGLKLDIEAHRALNRELMREKDTEKDKNNI